MHASSYFLFSESWDSIISSFTLIHLTFFNTSVSFIVTVVPGICSNPDVVLQDAQAAIPKGTLLAILITGVTYLGVALAVCKYSYP